MMVRAAVPEDVEAILALERRLPTAPHWPAEAYWTALAAQARCLLVAEQSGELLGYAAGSACDAEAELESVAVRKRSQGQGIGLELVQAVLGWAMDRGARTVLLEVRSASQGARRLYQRAGFEQVATRPDYYEDPPDDAVLMRWCVMDQKPLAG